MGLLIDSIASSDKDICEKYRQFNSPKRNG
jgi:hypothetical protein